MIVHSKMNPDIQYVPKFHVCSVCSCPLAKLQGPTKYLSQSYGDHYMTVLHTLLVQDENVSEYRCAYWEFSDP